MIKDRNDRPFRYPSRKLHVTIRDDAPMVFCGDSPSYRSVEIELTQKQLDRLRLFRTGKAGEEEYFESISRFVEVDMQLTSEEAQGE